MIKADLNIYIYISTTLFRGVFFHQAHPTTAQVKDATSALKKNS
jgi:hypothetical protein